MMDVGMNKNLDDVFTGKSDIPVTSDVSGLHYEHERRSSYDI